MAQTKGDLNEALELAERASRVAPGPNTLDTLGWVQLLRGNINAAVSAFTSALELEPNDQLVQYHLALAVAKQGHQDQAVTLLKGVLKSGAFAEQEQAQIELARLESR